MNAIVIVVFIICGCFANDSSNSIHQAKNVFENILKEKVNDEITKIKPLLNLLDGRGVISEETIPITQNIELNIKNLDLLGISKFVHDFGEIEINYNNGVNAKFELIVGWQGEQTFNVNLTHKVDIKPTSELAWLAGDGTVALSIKDSFIHALIELKASKLVGVAIEFQIGEETKFMQCTHGKYQLLEMMNASLHNEDVRDIATFVVNHFIKEFINKFQPSDTITKQALFSYLETIDEDLITSLVVLAQRMRDY